MEKTGSDTSGGATPALLAQLGAKLLERHWFCRHREDDGPALDLHRMAPDEAVLLLRVLAVSIQADGRVDAAETARFGRALASAPLIPDERRRLGGLPEARESLETILDGPLPARLAGRIQAAVMAVFGIPDPVQAAWLAYLARRLGLSAETVALLETRNRGPI